MKKVHTFFEENYINLVFMVAFFAVIGSFYFSNVEGLDPCYLCWYQRILIYPLVPLSIVSIAFKKRFDKYFILSLTIPGMLLAFYHFVVQKFGLGKEFLNCSASTPCTRIDFELLGFITIPFLSFIAFFTINVIIILSSRRFHSFIESRQKTNR